MIFCLILAWRSILKRKRPRAVAYAAAIEWPQGPGDHRRVYDLLGTDFTLEVGLGAEGAVVVAKTRLSTAWRSRPCRQSNPAAAVMVTLSSSKLATDLSNAECQSAVSAPRRYLEMYAPNAVIPTNLDLPNSRPEDVLAAIH